MAETQTKVNMDAVAEQAGRYGFAYLITVSARGRIHTSVVHPAREGDAVVVPTSSGHVARNCEANPEVSLVWPPAETTGYSLMLDGTATLHPAEGTVTVDPSRAVLHRPATRPSAPEAGDGCTEDCIEL